MRAYAAKWKAAAHAVLGGKCKECGFSDERALQIDHISGDGPRDVRYGQRGGSTAYYYKRVVESSARGENRYQLLCANCNWIKRFKQNEHGKREKD